MVTCGYKCSMLVWVREFGAGGALFGPARTIKAAPKHHHHFWLDLEYLSICIASNPPSCYTHSHTLPISPPFKKGSKP